MLTFVLTLYLGAAAAAPEPIPAYNRTLSAHPYPYAVKIHRFQAQGQSLEMAYMDIAPAGKPKGVVLLLHGKNFASDYWSSTIEVLVADGYRVVAPDQIGFGRSSKPLDLDYSFHALASWTADLLDALAIEEATVVGHSMGGMVATRFALLHPEHSRGLVLVNPIGLEDWRRKTPYRDVDTWTARILKATPDSIRAYMSNAYFAGAWKPEWDPLVTVQAGWALGPDREHMARLSALQYEMIYTQPVVYEFPDLQESTLLVIGERDRTALNRDMVSAEAAESLGRYDVLGKQVAETIPDATLVALPGVGHMPQVEAMDQWAAALTTFLATQW